MTTPPDDRGEASLARKTPSPHIHPSTAGEAFAAGAALAYWLPPPAPPLSLRDPNQHPSRSRQHACPVARAAAARSEEHTSELQSLMRNSYAVFCLKKKNITSH